MNTNIEIEAEEVSPAPITLQCLDEGCPGHFTIPAALGLHRFTSCDCCLWSYDVLVLVAGAAVPAVVVASHQPLTPECLDPECPGHLCLSVRPGVHRFSPCDCCPWSYDVSVWVGADGGVIAEVVASYAPGSTASSERGG
jgi:hypothetical protein